MRLSTASRVGRSPRALPATAVVIGILVLHQLPSIVEWLGVGLVVLGVALHRQGT
ncbi:MAG: hypothetical protein ACR2GP_08135 [Burkholderiaceae bacterium]